MAIELGDKVKHKITKFRGVVIAVTRWLNGCVRVTVQDEKLTKEGAIRPTETIDVDELQVTKKRFMPPPSLAPGGPTPAPKAMGVPKRR